MNYENYDLCFPDQPVVDLYLPIWANLPAFRHKPAFVWAQDGCASSSLTYEQLNTSVDSISNQLLLSLERGEPVVILCTPGLNLVEIIFACQRAGLLAIPITPPNPSFSYNNHHLIRVLSQAKPKAALASSSYINHVTNYTSSTNNRLSKLLQKLKWISTETLIKDIPLNFSKYNGCKENELYLIQYTSGATGIPKPVLVTAGAAAHNVRVARKAYDLHPNSIIVSWLPQYHDCGLMFLLLTIVSGATCVLASPNAFVHRPRLWLELITEYQATCTPVPLFTLPLVVKRGGINEGTSSINLASMKNLIIINEPIYKTSVEEFVGVFQPFGLDPSSISPSYGLAENCTFVSTAWRSYNQGKFPVYKNLLPSAKLPFLRDETTEKEEIEIWVVNEETEEPVEDGSEGEIWVSSASNASGYLDHPCLTRDVFSGRLKNKLVGIFLRTGDRGIIIRGEKQRYLYVSGRCSEMIGLENGDEIHPHFLESVVYNGWPNLLRGGCIAIFEISRRIAVVAELQKSVEEINNLSNICNWIRDAIVNEEKVEVGVVVVLVKSGSVPKTSSGKMQRWATKYKLERGEMKIVMKMEFGVNEDEKIGKENSRRKHISLLSSSL